MSAARKDPGAARRQSAKDARAAAEDAAAQADLERVYQHIVSRAPEHDFDPTIDRVRRLFELLGDPQHAFRTIHLTGTNGKTSTARVAERLVREHGLRTGLFTSPHLTSVTERIVVDGEPLPLEHDALRRLSSDELDSMDWLPADEVFVDALRSHLEQVGQ